MILLAPRDTTELREMAQFMLSYEKGPTAVRFPRGAGDENLPEGRTPIQLGKAEMVFMPESGETDVLIAAAGTMVGPSVVAAKILTEKGTHAAVMNARFLKPIDRESLVEWARRAHCVLTVEENARRGGYGDAVRDALSEAGLSHIPVRSIALPDKFVEHGAQPLIRKDCGLDAESIADAASALVSSSARLR
jgi:1-deoxy-D-xylulose-5-phosphate synthase